MFKIIIKYDLVAIYFVVWGSSLYTLFVLGSLFDLKMAFSGKGDKRSVACETIEPDEPVNNDFIRLSVMYFENRM